MLGSGLTGDVDGFDMSEYAAGDAAICQAVTNATPLVQQHRLQVGSRLPAADDEPGDATTDDPAGGLLTIQAQRRHSNSRPAKEYSSAVSISGSNPSGSGGTGSGCSDSASFSRLRTKFTCMAGSRAGKS